MSSYGSTGLKQKIEDIIDNLSTENINQSRQDDLLKILQNWHQEDKGSKRLRMILSNRYACFVCTHSKKGGKDQESIQSTVKISRHK